MKNKFIGVFALGLCLALPAYAQQGVDASVYNRLDRLERDFQTLQTELFRGTDTRLKYPSARDTTLPADSAARLNERLSVLESDMRDLTGRVERFQFSLDQVNRRIDQLIQDFSARLMGSSGAAVPPPAHSATAPQAGGVNAPDMPSVQPTPPKPESQNTERPEPNPFTPQQAVPAQPLETPKATGELPAGTPTQQYEYAFSLLKQSDFEAASTAFQKFLIEHPKHDLSGNAQYWLGETFYVREDYTKAAVNFLKAYQDFPKSSKAADSLLKLALSLGKLGSTKEACTTLAKLASEYPNADPTIKNRGAAEWQKMSCQQ